MTIATQRLITAEEFLQMPDPPDGSRQELVRGVIETMPPPSTYHGVCCSRLNRRIGNFVEERNLGHLASNDSGFITERDPDTVRGPVRRHSSRLGRRGRLAQRRILPCE
jgi:Uma2 family endonuclease